MSQFLSRKAKATLFIFMILTPIVGGLAMLHIYEQKLPPEPNKLELVTVIYLYGSNPTYFQTNSKIGLTMTFARDYEHNFGIYTLLYLLWYYDNVTYTYAGYDLYTEVGDLP